MSLFYNAMHAYSVVINFANNGEKWRKMEKNENYTPVDPNPPDPLELVDRCSSFSINRTLNGFNEGWHICNSLAPSSVL